MIMRTPERRIDDRIRELCAKLKATSNSDLEPILQELLELVHQKMERLRRRAARLLLKGEHLEPERRSSVGVDAHQHLTRPELDTF